MGSDNSDNSDDSGYAADPGSYQGQGDPTCGGCAHLKVEHRKGHPVTYRCAIAIRPKPMRETDPIDWRSRACEWFKGRVAA